MNQRRSMRFPASDDQAAVRLGDHRLEYDGTILNESFDGLAVLCEQVVPWCVGNVVRIRYRGVWERATVRRNDIRQGDKSVLGLEWMALERQGMADDLPTLKHPV